MPQPPRELPGFYYDPQKNRYFPIKGPIPGSSSSSSKPTTHDSPQTQTSSTLGRGSYWRKLKNRTSKLLRGRELDGNVITSRNSKCNFTEEFLKIHSSQPTVWKYQDTDRIGITDLKQIRIDVQTLEGRYETDVLLMGSTSGSLSSALAAFLKLEGSGNISMVE